MHGDFEEDGLPEDIEDGTLYLVVPHKNDLDLGRELVYQFLETEASEIEGQVVAAFRQRGAYAKFKSILERHGLLQNWYDFEGVQPVVRACYAASGRPKTGSFAADPG
jgi:hypothetical protein